METATGFSGCCGTKENSTGIQRTILRGTFQLLANTTRYPRSAPEFIGEPGLTVEYGTGYEQPDDEDSPGDSDFSGETIDSVGTDEELGGKLVAEHLINLGHRRIACLSKYENMKDSTWAIRRRTSFEETLRKCLGISYKVWKTA